jgi:hypothetical protein
MKPLRITPPPFSRITSGCAKAPMLLKNIPARKIILIIIPDCFDNVVITKIKMKTLKV